MSSWLENEALRENCHDDDLGPRMLIVTSDAFKGDTCSILMAKNVSDERGMGSAAKLFKLRLSHLIYVVCLNFLGRPPTECHGEPSTSS